MCLASQTFLLLSQINFHTSKTRAKICLAACALPTGPPPGAGWGRDIQIYEEEGKEKWESL